MAGIEVAKGKGIENDATGSKSAVNALVMPAPDIVEPELLDEIDHCFGAGDYVTRDGTDIHYVEEYDEDLITVVCIVAPSDDWAKPGEIERNLTRRYSKINRHFLRFAREEHKLVKQAFPDGWVDEP